METSIKYICYFFASAASLIILRLLYLSLKKAIRDIGIKKTEKKYREDKEFQKLLKNNKDDE